MMDSNSVNGRNYHEIIIYFVPYCGSIWCGFDYETITQNNLTRWTCISTK